MEQNNNNNNTETNEPSAENQNQVDVEATEATGSVPNFPNAPPFPPPAYLPKDEDWNADLDTNSSKMYNGPAQLDPQNGFTGLNDPNTSFPISPFAGVEYSGSRWICHLSQVDWIKKNPEGRLIFNLHAIIPKIHLQGISANRFFHSRDRLKPNEWASFTKFDKFMSSHSSKVGSVYTLWKEKVYAAVLLPHIIHDDPRPFAGIDPSLVHMIEDKSDPRSESDEINKDVSEASEEVRLENEKEPESSLTQSMSLDVEHDEEENNTSTKKRKRSKKTIDGVKRNTATKRANQMIEMMKKVCEEEQESFEDVLDMYILKNHLFLEGRVQKFGKEASKKKVQRVLDEVKLALDEKLPRLPYV